jgi:hypothetical protein
MNGGINGGRALVETGSASAWRSETRPQSRSGIGGGSGSGSVRGAAVMATVAGWLALSRLRVAWAWAGPRRQLCTCAAAWWSRGRLRLRSLAWGRRCSCRRGATRLIIGAACGYSLAFLPPAGLRFAVPSPPFVSFSGAVARRIDLTVGTL